VLRLCGIVIVISLSLYLLAIRWIKTLLQSCRPLTDGNNSQLLLRTVRIASKPFYLRLQVDRLRTLEGRQLTIIEWWAQLTQQQTFPALSQLAIDVLSAFAMSAESERTFSKARRTTSWKRSQLSANIIRWSELLKDWLHRGVPYAPPTHHIDSDQDSGN